jgi:hypothetical protein
VSADGTGQPGHWKANWCASKLPCLCERGANATPAYLEFARAEVEKIDSYLKGDLPSILRSILVLWALPPCLALAAYLVLRAVRVVRHGCMHVARSAPTAPKAPSTSFVKLDHAEAAGTRLRACVGFSSFQVGWMLLVVALTPAALTFMYDADSVTRAFGSVIYYLTALPWACALLLLTVRPINTAAIHGMGVVLWCGAVLMVTVHFVNFRRGTALYAGANVTVGVISSLCIIALSPVLPPKCTGAAALCTGDACRMPPRRMLHLLWLVLRLFFFGYGAALGGALFFDPLEWGGRIAPTWRADDDQAARLALLTSCLLAALVLSRATRGRVLRFLGVCVRCRPRSLVDGGASGPPDDKVAAMADGRRGTPDGGATLVTQGL